MKYILVSQGIKIYETYNRQDAIRKLYEMNNQWCDYKRNCLDNYEPYADNEVFMCKED